MVMELVFIRWVWHNDNSAIVEDLLEVGVWGGTPTPFLTPRASVIGLCFGIDQQRDVRMLIIIPRHVAWRVDTLMLDTNISELVNAIVILETIRVDEVRGLGVR
jgi:hypothetical protein